MEGISGQSNRPRYVAGSVAFVMCWLLYACTNSVMDHPESPSTRDRAQERLRALLDTPSLYRKETVALLLAEANLVAEELELGEPLPIGEEDLVEAFITPPGMARGMRALGNLTTSNYTYFFSVDNKFSFLVKTGLEKDYSALRVAWLQPVGRMDTNLAFCTATQLLSSVSMDVDSLNRECDVNIRAYTPDGKDASTFVPIYWVSWGRGDNPVASIELFLPTRTVRQLHVNESKYILRRQLAEVN